MAQKDFDKQPEFEEKLIRVSRVSKKTKGGDQATFAALMVIGDKKGRVGVGLGKAQGVVEAIRKGVRQAKKKMITVPIDGSTIPFRVEARFGAGHVLLKPAVAGSGVIAGGPVRAVVEAAGIRDISAKILGSDNQATSVYATIEAFKEISRIVKVRHISLKQDKVAEDVITPQPPVVVPNKQVKKQPPSLNQTQVKTVKKIVKPVVKK